MTVNIPICHHSLKGVAKVTQGQKI